MSELVPTHIQELYSFKADVKSAEPQLVRLIERLRCGCIAKDCRRHGSYIPGDLELAEAIAHERTLFPKSVRCAHIGPMTRMEQFHSVHRCDKCGEEFTIPD